MNIFHLQLLTSFFVGGVVATVLSILAERASKQTAGIIIGLPSTIPLSYVFIAWVLGPEAITSVAPTTPISTAAALIFLLVYLKIASTLQHSKRLSKIPLILISLFGAFIVWFAIAIPFGLFKFSNLWLAVAIQLLVCFVCHLLLIRSNKLQPSPPRKINYTWPQKIARAAFTGFVIVLATILAKTVNPVWGGVFSGFPAVFSSTLVILHLIYDTDFLYHVFFTAPLGHLQCTVFIVAAAYLFPVLGIFGGFFLSYSITLVFTFSLIKWAKAKL